MSKQLAASQFGNLWEKPSEAILSSGHPVVKMIMNGKRNTNL